MKKSSYSQQAKAFIKKIIRQRRKLITLGRSYKNRYHTEKLLMWFDTQLQLTYSDSEMAGFFTNHQNKIFALITGPNSRSHHSHRQQFHNLLTHAGIIKELDKIASEHNFKIELN